MESVNETRIENIVRELERVTSSLSTVYGKFENVTKDVHILSTDIEVLKIRLKELERIDQKINKLFEKVDIIEQRQAEDHTENKIKWGLFISLVVILIELGKGFIAKVLLNG